MPLSRELIAAAEAALPPADALPLPSGEIYRVLKPPHWARGSVRVALHQLVREGRAERSLGEPYCGGQPVWRWRRLPSRPAEVSHG